MNKTKFLVQLDESKFSSNQLAVCKGNAAGVAKNIHDQILEGKTSAISVAELFKFMNTIADEIKSVTDENGKNKFVDLVRSEIEKNSDDGKKLLSKYGTKFELAETNTQYTFDKCGDPTWNYYNKEIKALGELKKQRETFLKTITMPYLAGNIVDPGTGELIENVTLHPPIKTSDSSYKQTLSD